MPYCRRLLFLYVSSSPCLRIPASDLPRYFHHYPAPLAELRSHVKPAAQRLRPFAHGLQTKPFVLLNRLRVKSPAVVGDNNLHLLAREGKATWT